MQITTSGTYTDITQINENLEIARGVNADFPNLTSIGGYVDVRKNAKFTAPNLTSTGGDIYVRKNAKFTVPNLTSIGGYVDVCENAKFTVPNLTSVGGSVYVRENAKFTVPNLTSTGGSVYVRENAKFTVPNLTSTGGDIYVYENAKFTVPNLTSIGGSVDVCENAKFTVPNLTSVGGSVDVHENAKFTRSQTDIPYEASMLEQSFNSSRYTFADRIVARILHTRGQVRKVIIAGQTKASYLVSNGKCHAHGGTLKQAKESLEFKINAEKIQNDPIYPDTVVTPMYYHTVTGACETGISHWMKQVFTAKRYSQIEKSGIKAKDLMPILSQHDAYGRARFESLYTSGGGNE